MDIKIGNEVKQINNSLFVRSNINCVDPVYWYGELFGTFPVYRFFIEINRVNEDEEFDIYNVIFDDLVKSGEFTPINYEYNRENKKDSSGPVVGTPIQSNDIYAERYYLVSNTEPLVIYYEYDGIHVISHIGKDVIERVVDKYLMKYNENDYQSKCYIIVKDPDLYLDDFNVKLKGDLDFDMYNDGFEGIHNTIVKSIKDDENGLYLLYGKPGTGKSTYIRHLIKECGSEKRKFIYVPSSLFDDFTNPSILPFLLKNKGCIFIIEDCENLVTVDDGMRSDGITDLLNMTDGLLSDALDIKIICTFNTDYTKIDDALLRPGRCRCKYEFDLLDKDKANKVAKKLNLEKVDKDVSLAELFNPDVEFSESKKKKLGFNVK